MQPLTSISRPIPGLWQGLERARLICQGLAHEIVTNCVMIEESWASHPTGTQLDDHRNRMPAATILESSIHCIADRCTMQTQEQASVLINSHVLSEDHKTNRCEVRLGSTTTCLSVLEKASRLFGNPLAWHDCVGNGGRNGR